MKLKGTRLCLHGPGLYRTVAYYRLFPVWFISHSGILQTLSCVHTAIFGLHSLSSFLQAASGLTNVANTTDDYMRRAIVDMWHILKDEIWHTKSEGMESFLGLRCPSHLFV
eukprot:234652-Pelagomonas_calceolata.AAC.1